MAAPMTGSVDLLRHAEEIVRAACHAPSHHNAQPWAFRVLPDQVEVYADWSRRMPVTDPAGRQLLIGVGAAVYGVRLAVAALGARPEVALMPQPRQPELAAVVAAGRPGPASEEDRQLLAEIGRRHTVRGPFTDDPLPVPLQVALGNIAVDEGAELRWVVGLGQRRGLAALVTAAEHEQQADAAYRAELAHWIGTQAERQRAGVPTSALGPSAGAGHAAEFPMRDFTAGGPGRSMPAGRPEAHPIVVTLQTAADQPADWLRTGQALHRLLLAASAAGFAASYLNQPLEITGLRQRVREELNLDGYPQLILRLGRPAETEPAATPRRPLAEVLRP